MAAFEHLRRTCEVYDHLTVKELGPGLVFEGDEAVDYAFMGRDPDAADNRWLREALENRVPIV